MAEEAKEPEVLGPDDVPEDYELSEDDVAELPLPNDEVQREIPRDAYSLVDVAGGALVSNDPLSTYLAQLRHVAPLPAEQQQTLAEAYVERGDVDAAKQLIMSNLRLVVKIAREYHRRRVSLMELIQEGNVGLAEAIRRYDPYRGVKFTSYAQYWIRAMILNYLMNSMQLVKVGNTRSGRKLFYNLSKAREELVREGFLTPSTRQIADHLGVRESEVVDVARILDAPALSLDAPAPGFESGSLSSHIADDAAILPDDEVEGRQIQQRIGAAFAAFRASISDAREQAIWDQRVIADDPISLQELGDQFGVSRERIRQIEKILKDRFKEFWIDTVGEEEAAIIFRD
ncbi:MAG: sigma-70 family RNA polymerase sigma factor [Myxococcales bacterium]|nr:sigma-70 family RNA polymerase sigma factor [Myxococcales bacterium]MCB9531952.1 sigma-70 family RNA polymerase sigma factor [Myxococcales bacterium]MCB9532835.1 sigma-70 family RNA polymerase sigma factor [Myxococcales bacterium]